jgi:hypothetical protein
MEQQKPALKGYVWCRSPCRLRYITNTDFEEITTSAGDQIFCSRSGSPHFPIGVFKVFVARQLDAFLNRYFQLHLFLALATSIPRSHSGGLL